MGFTLAVKGQDTEINLGVDVIKSANIGVNTPNNSMAKSSTVAATLFVTGKLTHNNMLPSDKETSKLLKWSLVTAQNADAYRDVTVQVVTTGQPFRTMHFPNAFIIDYNERYSDSKGMGEFTLVLRQKADKFSDVQAE
ncbi:carbohydrate-selective porin OprB [Sporomusaceae bacterium BoRhaA]|uniref:membrane-associated protease 1 n=1 Tax=Pelorhabdus rhamnosifermentans TaxID=2772457 RepID=UPI001C063564|nr:membrane-associated protease 1 [Pelorhabdus rhamnosifermentans]MBU2702276.1 carbohydrate-selective porin OprB [Pelorhabdus rhamnosifermentans]